jgi:predicted dienelactone hydrolase
MRLPILATLLSLLIISPSWGEGAPELGPFKAGLTSRQIAPPELYDWRGAETHALVTTIWYPADRSAEERPLRVGPAGAELLVAGEVARDAPLAPIPARFPLILLSHGTGGSAQSIAWLATALAAQGYVVAGVNHPGNNALEPYTMQGFLLWWKRAQDISSVLDAMLADRAFGPRIDPERIGAAGFSLGGYTMIALAGGITSWGDFTALCQAPSAPATCKPPPEFPDLDVKAGAAARSDPCLAAALQASDRSYREPRIRAVFAIAPALGPAFTPESLKAIAIPVAIVAGAGDSIVPVDGNAKYFAATIHNAALTIFPGGVGHYVFIDVCTDAGRQRPFCSDAPGVDRAAVHRETAALAVKFFAGSSNRREERRRSSRLMHVWPRILGDEAVAIGHRHLRQRFGIEHRVLGNDAVEVEDIGGDGIDLVGAEGLRRVEGHGAADVVEERGGVRPIAADRLHRARRRQRPGAADQPVHWLALSLVAMAGGAALGEDPGAVARAAFPRRQAPAVGARIDVPAGDLRRRGLASEAVARVVRAEPARHQQYRQGRGGCSRPHC